MNLFDQPLVWPELGDEVAPYRKYFQGIALNAGSGGRPLQPQHACPQDFARFTEAELALSAGFEVVETRAVHGFGQTLAWLLWEYVKENPPPKPLRPVYGWLLRQMSLGRILRGKCANAENTFYVVAHKPGASLPPSPSLTCEETADWFHPLLVCPHTRRPLQSGHGILEEPVEGRRYSILDGSVNLLPQPNT